MVALDFGFLCLQDSAVGPRSLDPDQGQLKVQGHFQVETERLPEAFLVRSQELVGWGFHRGAELWAPGLPHHQCLAKHPGTKGEVLKEAEAEYFEGASEYC